MPAEENGSACCSSGLVLHWLKPLMKSLPEFSCWLKEALQCWILDPRALAGDNEGCLEVLSVASSAGRQ